jgi:Icc-related predicted phosphoesterase
MKINITHISDTHNKHKSLNLIGGDILIHSGDISSIGYKHEVKSFLQWFKKQPYTYKIFISGNHDICFDPNRQRIDDQIWINDLFNEFEVNKDKQIYYLNNSSIQLFGHLNIWGSPITPDFNPKRWAFNKTRGEDIQKTWNLIPENLDILITHGPSLYHGDYEDNSRLSVGCYDLRNIIKIKKPTCHLFGHIHSGYGMSYDENTIYLNSSVVNNSYTVVNNPINFFLDIDTKEINFHG